MKDEVPDFFVEEPVSDVLINVKAVRLVKATKEVLDMAEAVVDAGREKRSLRIHMEKLCDAVDSLRVERARDL